MLRGRHLPRSVLNRRFGVGAFSMLLIVASFALSLVAVAPRADAMGAPCPQGSNLYSATILSAKITYQDAYTKQNVTVDVLTHPNATLNVEFDNINELSNFPVYSSNMTFVTAAESNNGTTSTGAVYENGLNGSYGYQGCISPVVASTSYNATIPIDHPASYANTSQISDNVGGSGVEFMIHWVYPSTTTTTSSSSSSLSTTVTSSSSTSSTSESSLTVSTSSSSSSSTSSLDTAPEFPSAVLPLLLLVVVAAAAFSARSLKNSF